MARLSGSVDLHSVTSISLDKIRELESDDGTQFCTRTVTIAFADSTDLTLDLYARDADADDTTAGSAFRALEVLV